jgi:opacity protein-like surface antigen
MKKLTRFYPFKSLIIFYKVLILSSAFLIISLSNSNGQLVGRIGGSVGNGFNNKQLQDLTGEDFKIDENNLAWKIFAATSWKFLGAEGGYRDFGTVEGSTDNGTVTSKSRGGDIYGTGAFKIGIFEIFGKAGGYFGRTKNEFYNTSGGKELDESEREASFAWGIGAALNLGMLHVRLEYENMHISSGNLAMLSLGAGINLKKRKD